MEDQILKEIREIKAILSRITSSDELPARQRFSKAVLDKTAREFMKLSIERGDWIKEYEIYRIFPKIYGYPGKFIIEHFALTSYFKKGKSLYFNRKDLVALKNELKQRKVNLGKYMELERDKEKFHKCLESIKAPKVKIKRARFKIPEDLRNIDSIPYTIQEEVIREHLKKLEDEFRKFNIGEYVDIYHDDYAMFKSQYYFEKYLNPEVKRRCRKWCDDFNYANHALKQLSDIESRSYEVD